MPLAPLPPSGTPWNAAVIRAYLRIKDSYISAQALVTQDETDALRLKTWESILEDHHQLVRVMEQEGLPGDWVNGLSASLDELIQRIRQAVESSLGRCVLFPI